MRKRYAFVLLLAPLLVPQPGRAQSIMEGGGVQGMAAGLGAGMAASANHGNLVRRSYNAALGAEQATLAQTRVIEQYVKAGCTYEAKKEWEYAQKSFSYALQVIAMRDGSGSPQSVPVLRHLVSVSKGQKDLGQAITYQRTVYAFAQGGKINEPGSAMKEEANLAGLYIAKQDYASAEPLLRDFVKKAPGSTAIAPEAQRSTRQAYANVLRKLNRDDDAAAIEAMDHESAQPVAETKPVAPVAETKSNAPIAKTSPSTKAPPKVEPDVTPPVATNKTEPALSPAKETKSVETAAETKASTTSPDGQTANKPTDKTDTVSTAPSAAGTETPVKTDAPTAAVETATTKPTVPSVAAQVTSVTASKPATGNEPGPSNTTESKPATAAEPASPPAPTQPATASASADQSSSAAAASVSAPTSSAPATSSSMPPLDTTAGAPVSDYSRVDPNVSQ